MIRKICTKCSIEKDIVEFYKRTNYDNGLSWCKKCFDTHVKTTYSKEKSRITGLKRSYGITVEQFNQLALDQDYRCAICGLIPDQVLCVDHCHSSSKIRGLLCGSCNKALGFFKDNTDTMCKAIKYLDDTKD